MVPGVDRKQAEQVVLQGTKPGKDAGSPRAGAEGGGVRRDGAGARLWREQHC